jgi:hypothetical protein
MFLTANRHPSAACRSSLAPIDPGRDISCVKPPTVKDAPRAIRGEFENGPIAVQLDESAAIDGPQETGTTKMCDGPITAAAEQGQGVPAQLNGTLRPVFTRDQEIAAVAQKLLPSVLRDVS